MRKGTILKKDNYEIVIEGVEFDIDESVIITFREYDTIRGTATDDIDVVMSLFIDKIKGYEESGEVEEAEI